jgi:phosphopantothenoylcysteine decarboxylase/phosphopantothenate--cysteine ligase
MLTGRRIVLGVTGGIAAYKAAYLARRLLEAGCEVRVIMTGSARKFVGEQTFSGITGRPVETALFGAANPIPHTELGRWADAVVVAPATTNLLGRLANGLANDLLTNTLLATRAPVVLAPAMHTEMWEHPATQRNMSIIEADGHIIVGPAKGPLAGDEEGVGRMVEPEEIVSALEALFDA